MKAVPTGVAYQKKLNLYQILIKYVPIWICTNIDEICTKFNENLYQI